MAASMSITNDEKGRTEQVARQENRKVNESVSSMFLAYLIIGPATQSTHKSAWSVACNELV